MYPDFAGELLRRCREAGIHTAIETCGHTPWENMARIAACCDLFLYDLKLIDPEKAKKWTGASNRLILENVRKLSESGRKSSSGFH